MKGVTAAIVAGVLTGGLAPISAAAQDGMGMAGIHDWVKIAGKTCMADHFHDGQGTGPTKAQAQSAAIRAWTDFTAWEYGRRWAKWQNSVSRSGSCTG